MILSKLKLYLISKVNLIYIFENSKIDLDKIKIKNNLNHYFT